MQTTTWASYESVDPPKIDPDFFYPDVQANEILFNPIAQTYNEQVTQPDAELDTSIIVEEGEPESTKEEKAESKKKEAKKIVKSKTNSPKFSSDQEFTRFMTALYRRELQRRGLNPNLATMLVAQDANETAWGKKVLGKNNYGNITTTGNDWTVKTGKRHWKDFDSVEDYVSYKISFLSKKRYRFFDYASINDVSGSMQNLADRGYDPGNPRYGVNIMRTHNSVLKYIT